MLQQNQKYNITLKNGVFLNAVKLLEFRNSKNFVFLNSTGGAKFIIKHTDLQDFK